MPDFLSPVPRPNFAIQGWGEPRTGHTHEGIDFPVPVGTPIRAVDSGTVITSVDSTGTSGNYVAVKHADGFVSRYMHLSKRLVQKGEAVSRGQIIAASGNTGIDISGPHLHFDIKMVPSMLANYSSLFGTPVGGFGRNLFEGIGVPAEPLIPVDKYSEAAKEGAGKFGIPLYAASAGIGAVLIGIGAFFAWRLWKKR